MFQVNNEDTRTTPKVNNEDNIVNFEHVSHLFSSVSIVNFDQVNAG